jgi:hypothetical protein
MTLKLWISSEKDLPFVHEIRLGWLGNRLLRILHGLDWVDGPVHHRLLELLNVYLPI